MNLLFAGEQPEEFEERRVKANVVRCMYLLERSVRGALLSPDLLQKCRVYISYANFKRILER